MTKVVLNKKISQRIANGHPWIFNNEVNRIDGNVEPGSIVEVYTHDDKFIGKGYINPKSQIIVRLLSRQKNETIDEQFFFKRIQEAWNYRQKIGYTENCRLIFGEADFMPALIIDKFNDYFVIQTLSLGMEVWKEAIVKALQTIFSERNL
jgi:23S rRNA (cytosine1962-C5)-methyltransferase